MRAVIAPLKGEKLVDRPDRARIRSSNADLASPRKLPCFVRDLVLPLGHDSCAGHVARVNESRNGEIATRKTTGDVAHVRANVLDALAISRVPLKLDPTTIGEWLEPVS